MAPRDYAKLRGLTDFPSLVAYLRDELDWPIEIEDADEVVFDYDPTELLIDPKHAVNIKTIKQVRPLVDTQPWGIFYVEFESKRLPVVVLRRILRALVPTSRRRDPDRPVWRMDDLLFISAQGEVGYRSISFAHFRQREDRIPELRTFSWDSRETHFYYLKNLNLEALRWPEDETHADAWREQWGRAFTVAHRYTITTSQMLAREMAHHARTVRELVNEVYALETDDDPLHQLYGSFKETLLHDLTPDAFADMVAQTVAYGLFSAATESEDLTYDRMVELIPDTNPFLKDLLAQLTTEGAVDLEELGVGQLVDLLRQTDVEAILRDFGRRTRAGREDPVIHFYELFLREYDREQKVRRGVFYTPDPIVSYIVRSVDHLLKTEFGLAEGLADTSVDPESGEPLVQILDPAAGTGTFLAHVIDQVERTVKAKPGVDWNAYVDEHLLPRLNGFELMMAPYAVAHMKLGLKLRQTGYDFSSGERLRVYLTNTLEEPVEIHETLALAGFLSKESNEAARVKREVPITVVIGNPPYSYESKNVGEWVTNLARDYYYVDDQPLGERNPKGLLDDYVKFIRFAQWRIEQTGHGILAFICNHAYLDNPTFRGMRQSLIQTFNDIYVLDLHGNSRKAERCPDGSPDQNVFDIQQGVAIGIFVKEKGKIGPATVRHADLWGSRAHKYRQLLQENVQTLKWDHLTPRPPFYLFIPQNIDLLAEFEKGWGVTEAFLVTSSGLFTSRDSLTIHGAPEEVWDTVCDFVSLPPEQARQKYSLPQDVRDWKVHLAQSDIRASGPIRSKVVPILYRPFDVRFTYYTGRSRGFICMPRAQIMNHMLAHQNIGLITVRQVAEGIFNHLLVTDSIVECRSTLSNKGYGYLFPLYLYPAVEGARRMPLHFDTWPSGQDDRVPNLDPGFVADLEKRLGWQFVPDGAGDLEATLGPEDVFHYAYAVFHSPTYRTRYAEFLKIDFPRLPLTSDLDLFRSLCTLGADLVALHLLEDDYPAASWNRNGEDSPLQHPITAFVEGVNGTTMGAFSKGTCYEDGKVYLDTSQWARSSYFEGVPEDVWNFYIGGYQVCRKWLYDRRGKRGEPGRTLTPDDIVHYQRIVVAIKETMRLMEEIDTVIPSWPLT